MCNRFTLLTFASMDDIEVIFLTHVRHKEPNSPFEIFSEVRVGNFSKTDSAFSRRRSLLFCLFS